MENKEYLEGKKALEDLKLFSMAEWIEAEKKLENKWELLYWLIGMLASAAGFMVGLYIKT